MRIFFILIVLNTILGCKPIQKEESKELEQEKQWSFWAVDWHPSKDQIAVGGSNDSFLGLFSLSNFPQLKKYPYKGTITKTKWHPTENKLAISVQDGKSNSTIFNLDTEQSIQLDSVCKYGARAIGWNHSGDLLAVGDYDGHITLYNENGTFIKKVDTKQKGIIGLDWHPTKNLIVAVGEYITMYG
ncbi:MAG: hypothetical protein P1U56_17620 [Saprospiraceae bacterium]|nr:hypothetical protein [Saprospiraceae bacterium]